LTKSVDGPSPARVKGSVVNIGDASIIGGIYTKETGAVG